LILIVDLVAAGAGHAASTYVTISSPIKGATVHGTIAVATTESNNVSWINVFVDGVWIAANPPTQSRPYSISWNSTTVADGKHTISVTGYRSRNAAIANASVAITAQNHAATPTPTPRSTPTPASSYVQITAPASGAIVQGTITVATSESASVSWVNFFVDSVWFASNPSSASPPYSVPWNSASVANGSHTLSVTGYNSSNAAIANAQVGIVVQNGAAVTATPSPRATPSPLPTTAPTSPPTSSMVPTPSPAPTRTASPQPTATGSPTPTPTPPAGSFPISDSAAAAMVVLNPSFEPRPDNYPANDTVPTAAQLSQVGALSFLDSHGNGLLAKATGNYTGTTDEILQWAANKWGFDPDITRANAVTETHWHQYDIGDIGNGVSLGILQVKSADFTGTCSPVSLNGGNTAFATSPLCLTYNSTAFAADYKLAYQRACMDGSITYLNSETPTTGYPTYANATGDARLWGCIGDWYSGSWYDSGAISYVQDVQNNLSTKPWLQPGF